MYTYTRRKENRRINIQGEREREKGAPGRNKEEDKRRQGYEPYRCLPERASQEGVKTGMLYYLSHSLYLVSCNSFV